MIETRAPREGTANCSGCNGGKGAPLACVFTIANSDRGISYSFSLCEECGRDAANAIGFMCIREGGWSKLEPRKRGRR